MLQTGARKGHVYMYILSCSLPTFFFFFFFFPFFLSFFFLSFFLISGIEDDLHAAAFRALIHQGQVKPGKIDRQHEPGIARSAAEREGGGGGEGGAGGVKEEEWNVDV